MSVEIDRPSSWVPFKSANQCDGCFAGCCTLPVEVSASDLVRLGVATDDEISAPKKLFRRLHREGIVRTFHSASQFYILEQRNARDCYFLHPVTRRCTVYEKRPETCRNFPRIGPRPGYCPKQAAPSPKNQPLQK